MMTEAWRVAYATGNAFLATQAIEDYPTEAEAVAAAEDLAAAGRMAVVYRVTIEEHEEAS